MATQSVTVSLPPAPGASSRTSGTSGMPAPAGKSGADYTLSDLELLGAAEDSAAQEVPSPGETPANPPQQPKAASEQAESSADFAPAFALPGIGPKLREICDRESAYRATFANVEQARAAAAAQQELSRLDALMESRDPRAHAELLSGLNRLSPESFRSLALAFAEQLPKLDAQASRQVAQLLAAQPQPASAGATRPEAQLEAAQRAGAFLQAVNADAEQVVRTAVESRVEELMPDAPEGARQKISTEIYRELDAALRADPELQEQVRESVRRVLGSPSETNPGNWRSGPGESLARFISRRAKVALPSVAKRVITDWTETVLRSSQARRSRQSESASRAEIGRGGAPGPVPVRQRSVDYARMSDEEILNLD